MGGTGKSKRVTISDVAKEAKVSIAAVSRILNNSYDGFSARPETKERVYAAVNKLGYRPSRAAVRLATGRHNAIGLCYPVHDSLMGPIDTNSIPQVFRHFDLLLVQHGISRALADANMDLVLMPRHEKRTTAELINQSQETVDGLIWINPEEDSESLSKVIESGIKTAIVGPAPMNGDFVNVRTEESLAGRIAMGHLIVCNARVVMVVIPESRRTEQASVERLQGIEKAKEDFTTPIQTLPVYVPSERDKALALLRKTIEKERPDGILTFGQSTPFVVMEAVTAAGLSIPKDIRMAGFEENLTFLLSTPKLTGLRYPIEEMCFRAASMLLDYIKSGESPKQDYMTPQLIARDSCR